MENKSYGDYKDEAEDKWNRSADKYEANRKEPNYKPMSKKKKMIRVSEYARLVGESSANIHDKINREELSFEMIGGTRHVAYPDEELIKFKPVK